MRFLRLTDKGERTYDSCLPDYSEMLSLSSENSEFTFNGDAVKRFFTSDAAEIFESNITESKIKQFPFEGNPKRNIQAPSAILSLGEVDFASFPADVTGVERDPLEVVYLTRYSFVSKSPVNTLPDYTRTIKPFAALGNYDPDENLDGVDLSDKLVSSYFMTSSADGVLYDLSGVGNHLDLTPTLDGIVHPTPDPSAIVPVQNLSNDGSLSFTGVSSDNDVRLIAARTAMSSHKMVLSVASTDTKFTISMTFKRSSVAGTQYLLQRGEEIGLGSAVFSVSYEMFIDSSNRLVFRIYESDVAYRGVATAINVLNSTSQWYNVTVSYDGVSSDWDAFDHLNIWVNGEYRNFSSDYSASSGNMMQEDDDWRLWVGAGRKSNFKQPDSSKEFIGIIHSLHIWKARMLNDVEVSALASAELYGTTFGTISHRTDFPQFVLSRPTRNGTFRYGISNVRPEFASVAFRPDHYGFSRDMLEQRRSTSTFEGFNPIKVRFVSGSTVLPDPTDTHAQNVSSFATSSLPYFDDDVARNRSDNPDQRLLDVLTI